jgi:hypothetical protein
MINIELLNLNKELYNFKLKRRVRASQLIVVIPLYTLLKGDPLSLERA